MPCHVVFSIGTEILEKYSAYCWEGADRMLPQIPGHCISN